VGESKKDFKVEIGLFLNLGVVICMLLTFVSDLFLFTVGFGSLVFIINAFFYYQGRQKFNRRFIFANFFFSLILFLIIYTWFFYAFL